MPSGFQQDNNQLSPGYYRVVINMGAIGEGSSANWANLDNAPSDGKITPLSWDGCAYSSITNLWDTTNQYIPDALARGNLRFQAIVETLSNVADCQILDIEAYADDDIENQANNGSLAFTVKFDRNEFVGPAYHNIQAQDMMQNNDYANGVYGTTTLDGVTYQLYYSASDNGDHIDPAYPEQAVRDLVWRALARPNWNRSVRVYDVAKQEGIQSVITVGTPVDNNQNMFNDISVNELDGTTTTISFD